MVQCWLILGAEGHGRSVCDATGTLVNGTPDIGCLVFGLGFETVD